VLISAVPSSWGSIASLPRARPSIEGLQGAPRAGVLTAVPERPQHTALEECPGSYYILKIHHIPGKVDYPEAKAEGSGSKQGSVGKAAVVI
jgi:hypothetical protein